MADFFFFLSQDSIKDPIRDNPGGPVVRSLPSHAEGAGLIPGQGAKIPRASRPESQNINNRSNSNIVTESIKTLKMIHIKFFFKRG